MRLLSRTLCAFALAATSTLAAAVPISGTVASGDLTTVAALTGGAVIDFDAGPVGDFASLTLGGVTFAGIGAPITVSSDFIGSFNSRGVNSLQTGFDLNPDVIEITLSSVASAFGFLWGASDNVWRMDVFDLADTLLESVLIPNVEGSNAGDYFGVVTPGIARILLTDTFSDDGRGDYVFLDNFTFVTDGGNDVPEPATALLLGAGLLGFRWRRQRVA